MALERTDDSSKPTAREVNDFHTNADTDSSVDAMHHTIGPDVNQAASGAHTHRGGDSLRLLEGLSITGTKAGTNSVILGSIVALLAELGAEDKST